MLMKIFQQNACKLCLGWTEFAEDFGLDMGFACLRAAGHPFHSSSLRFSRYAKKSEIVVVGDSSFFLEWMDKTKRRYITVTNAAKGIFMFKFLTRE